METRIIRADQLRRGHVLMLDRNGEPTRYWVELVERAGSTITYSARPISRTGRLWNGRAHRVLALDTPVEIVRQFGG